MALPHTCHDNPMGLLHGEQVLMPELQQLRMVPTNSCSGMAHLAFVLGDGELMSNIPGGGLDLPLAVTARCVQQLALPLQRTTMYGHVILMIFLILLGEDEVQAMSRMHTSSDVSRAAAGWPSGEPSSGEPSTPGLRPWT